jgi:hypothetical protein
MAWGEVAGFRADTRVVEVQEVLAMQVLLVALLLKQQPDSPCLDKTTSDV